MRHIHRPAVRLAMALGLLAVAIAVAGCGKPPQPLAPPEAPTVTVQNPQLRSYAPTKEVNGRRVTKDPVKVVPQVSGMLVRRLFEEGKSVEKDKTILFEIDKTQFDADLKKAKADIAKAEADAKNWVAQIKLADADFARADDAMKRGVGSKNDLDKAAASVDVAKAQLEVARASKESAVAAEAKAAENLRYCTILAPASGLVGIATVAGQ